MNKVLAIILGIMGGFVILVIVVALSFFAFVKGTYNGLVTDKVAAQTGAAQIDAQLQRRYDLLNEMVGATKGALNHETTVYQTVAKAMSAFQQAQASGNQSQEFSAGASLGNALRGYLVVVQQYPQLQALQSVQNLQVDIEGSENRLSVARQRYNEAVQTYDQDLQVFPGNLVAGYFHFQSLPFYQEDSNAKTAPTINLGQ